MQKVTRLPDGTYGYIEYAVEIDPNIHQTVESRQFAWHIAASDPTFKVKRRVWRVSEWEEVVSTTAQ